MDDAVLKIAAQEGVSPEAIRKWRERGSVPHRWRLPILERARGEGIALSATPFEGPVISIPTGAAAGEVAA